MGSKMHVDLLSSKAQAIDHNFLFVGLDAEVLPRLSKKVLWPHRESCPQDRGDARWEGEDCDWHGDGYAFEVCVTPTHCLDVLLSHVSNAFSFLSGKYGKSKYSLEFEVPTIYEIPTRVAASAPARVRQLGCMPSFNVYDNPGDPESLGKTERTTGCHLHISHPWLDHEKAKKAVKWADVLVGNAWNYISPEPVKVERRRREAYGRAGEHRRNNYPNGMFGFEYRVLPGRVLGHPAYTTLMFSLLRWAVMYTKRYGEPSALLSKASQAAINGANKSLSETVLDKIPFTDDSRRLLKYLHKRPLPVLSANRWADAGQARFGHRKLFNQVKQEGGI